MPQRPVVAIVGSGEETEPAVSTARELGRRIAEKGWVLVTGGRDAGVMRAANQGAKSAKESLTIGILPDRKTEVSADVDVAVVTDLGEARNNIIVLTADVVIACGIDDPGTASEVALAIKNGKPVILLCVSDSAKEFFNSMDSELVHIVNTSEEAIGVSLQLLL